MLYGGLAGAVITLIISITLYVKLGIPQAFEDLTGIKLRKGNTRLKKIEEKERNTTSEIMLKKQYAEDASASESPANRGVKGVKRHSPSDTEYMHRVAETELISNHNMEQTALLDESVYHDETSLLHEEVEETTLLSEVPDETVLLEERVEENYFIKEVDVMVVHSSSKL